MGGAGEGASQNISRKLTADDLGIRGELTKLDATLSVYNGVATVRVNMIEGNVQSRAKRILTPLSSYQPIEEVGASLFPLRDFAVLHGATPLGVYSNTYGESQEALLVSDVGVFLNCGEEVRFVAYKTIDKVDVAAGGKIVGADTTALKSEADGLLVTAGHSAPVFLPVRNGNGNTGMPLSSLGL